jgi:hypothetical protein
MPDDTTAPSPPIVAEATPPEFVELLERHPSQRFWEIAYIRDRDGIIAVITERATDGRISFGLFREFEKDGHTERSAYLAHRHIPGARRLLMELDRRLELIEDRSRQARRMAG